MTDWYDEERMKKVVVVFFSLLITQGLYNSMVDDSEINPAEELIGDVPAPESLTQHSEEFKQDVVQVTDGIYMAIGFGLSNSILIEAPEGAIIVDTTESIDAASEVFAAFRNITDSPVKVIIYTNFHADHIQGAKAFIDESSHPEIWAHETMSDLVEGTSKVLPLYFSRTSRQLGIQLARVAPSAFRNSGIGSHLRFGVDESTMFVPPTHLMRGSQQEVVMAGLAVTLVHVPGETTDQLGVWIPSKEAFLCGDNFYRAFPNLYAIRGTPTRDTLHWVNSLDKIIWYEPEFLIPSHSRHLVGKEHIRSVLTDYRDAIKLVHDQTVRYMNKGMLPDDIVTKVQLPESLAKSPFLQTFYGTVEWSVRAVFERYMGWFSGNIAELSKHSSSEKAKRMINLAGGESNIIEAAKNAIEGDDYKWALELATQVFILNPDNIQAKELRVAALKALASLQVSANGRNYYLTTALEDYGLVESKVPLDLRKAAIALMEPDKLFELISLKLKAEEVEGVYAVIVFDLTDIDEVYTLRIRNSVMDVLQGETQEPLAKLTVEYETLKGIIANSESLLALYRNGELEVEGSIVDFNRFMGYFDSL